MSVRLSSCFLAGLVIFASRGLPETTLTVAAASDLSALEPDLRAAFCPSAGQCTLGLVSSASSILSGQISNGAPFDVFLSANAEYVD